MKRIFYYTFIIISLLIPATAKSQYTVGEGLQQGAADAFMNTLEKARQAKERQKMEEEMMKLENPDYKPPREIGIPYLALEAGWSHFRGEHIGLKAALMGFNIYGGVGQEWIFHNNSDKKLLWYAGCGYLFGDIYNGAGESSIDITAGQSPACHDIGILGSFSMGYFFGRPKRFGVKGTLGVGCGNLDQDEIKFIWEVGVGFIVKLWANY